MHNTAVAQSEIYHLDKNSVITIEGTSTVHDWTVTVDDFHSSMTIQTNGSGSILTNTSIELLVHNMKSRIPRMDEIMHGTMKKDIYPVISFVLDSTQSRIQGDLNNLNITTTGNLTIAGTERRISVELDGSNKKGMYHLTGSKNMKMTDYSIEPPSFMGGSIRTGDEITVSFNLLYSPEPK
ncbi:MAG: YceI family protein [Balneolales bacterium]